MSGVERDQQRVALGPIGDQLKQRDIGIGIVIGDAKRRDHGTGVGERLSARGAETLGALVEGDDAQRALDLRHDGEGSGEEDIGSSASSPAGERSARSAG